MDLLSLLVLVLIHPDDVKLDSRQVGQPGKERTMYTQRGYYKSPGLPFPQKFKFSLPDKQNTPYPAGWYFIDPNSFGTGDYDSLELSRFDLKFVPIPADLKKQLGLTDK